MIYRFFPKVLVQPLAEVTYLITLSVSSLPIHLPVPSIHPSSHPATYNRLPHGPTHAPSPTHSLHRTLPPHLGPCSSTSLAHPAIRLSTHAPSPPSPPSACPSLQAASQLLSVPHMCSLQTVHLSDIPWVPAVCPALSRGAPWCAVHVTATCWGRFPAPRPPCGKQSTPFPPSHLQR